MVWRNLKKKIENSKKETDLENNNLLCFTLEGSEMSYIEDSLNKLTRDFFASENIRI